MFTLQPVVFLEETTSTNDVASSLISSDKATEGTLVLTDFQTKGRGQRGNGWASNKGENLLMSLIFKPEWLSAKDTFLLNMCVALGVYDYVVLRADSHVGIKWPNDILADKKKIAGILIENTFRGSSLSWSIAGIGVNLNQTKFKEGFKHAISLHMISRMNFVPQQEAVELRRNIFYWYEILMSCNSKVIKETYHQRLFGLNELRNYKYRGSLIQGSIRGVDNMGRLVVEKMDGEIVFPDIKEIGFLL